MEAQVPQMGSQLIYVHSADLVRETGLNVCMQADLPSWIGWLCIIISLIFVEVSLCSGSPLSILVWNKSDIQWPLRQMVSDYMIT